MRITPLVCWSCNNWFIPKTLRKSKFCCNACRQQGFLKKAIPNFGFKYNNDEDLQEWRNILASNCKENKPECVECLFDRNYELYCSEVYKRGVDKYQKSAQEWLSITIQN
jgi:hypothetical protein